jgi:hypothetical protein
METWIKFRTLSGERASRKESDINARMQEQNSALSTLGIMSKVDDQELEESSDCMVYRSYN